jgi:hypothetical protein
MNAKVTLIAAALGLASFTLPAHADVIWIVGNVPQEDENVLLNTGITGPLLTGTLNMSGATVNFSSASGDLVSPSAGQARIEPADGNDPFNSLTFWLADGGTFASAIFNLPGDSGLVEISVSLANGSLLSDSFATGSGENFFTVVAINGDRISSITVSADGSFSDMRQIRLGGYQPGTAVPDSAASVVLVGLGCVALAGLRRRLR